jgi:tRNA-dihydrouridine synthase 3
MGWMQIVEALQLAGAAAVVVHGRTMEQRYKKPADWELVGQAVSSHDVPIIGNGDILTHYEVCPSRDMGVP